MATVQSGAFSRFRKLFHAFRTSHSLKQIMRARYAVGSEGLCFMLFPDMQRANKRETPMWPHYLLVVRSTATIVVRMGDFRVAFWQQQSELMLNLPVLWFILGSISVSKSIWDSAARALCMRSDFYRKPTVSLHTS